MKKEIIATVIGVATAYVVKELLTPKKTYIYVGPVKDKETEETEE